MCSGEEFCSGFKHEADVELAVESPKFCLTLLTSVERRITWCLGHTIQTTCSEATAVTQLQKSKCCYRNADSVCAHMGRLHGVVMTQYSLKVLCIALK